MDWPRLLAYITGTVDRDLFLRNEFLVAENRILRAQIKGRLCLSQGEPPCPIDSEIQFRTAASA